MRRERGLSRAAAVLLLLATLAPAAAAAQGLDPRSVEGLGAALRVLTDPALRAPALGARPEAAAIDRQIRALLGSDALAQEFYEVAAAVFDELTRATGGDPGRMTETLARGQSDPAQFAAMLSPATLERLSALAGKIADRQR